MSTENEKPTVYAVMKQILAQINSPQEQNNLAGNLAAIRNSIGKNNEDAVEVWPLLFPQMPTEYLGNGPLTREEKALLITLQLYALGQQGSNKMQSNGSRSFGESLRNVRTGLDSAVSLDRRFNTMLTATSFDEFVYHLRQLFKYGKSHDGFSVDFPRLAQDLFWYQNGTDKQVCLKWARDYYRPEKKDTGDSSETSENTDKTRNEEAAL